VARSTRTRTTKRKASEWRQHRWKLLAQFEADQERQIGFWRLSSCGKCDGSGCVGRSYPFGPPLGFPHWPACPVSLLKSAAWQYVVQLYNAANVAPLSGWPVDYPAWVVDALEPVGSAMQEKARADAKAKGG